MILTATLNEEKSQMLWPRNLNVFPNFYLEVFPLRWLQKSKNDSSFIIHSLEELNFLSFALYICI